MDKIKEIIKQVEELKKEQKFSQAISILEKALINYSGEYKFYEELSDIYLFRGELNKAIKSINFALALNSNSVTGNYLKGFILLSRNKAQEAVKFLEKSNKLFGNNSEVLRNLGWGYVLLGESDKGISILKRALLIDPSDELITEDLAMALIGSGKISEGNTLLKKIGKASFS